MAPPVPTPHCTIAAKAVVVLALYLAWGHLEEKNMTYVKGKLSDYIGDRIVYRNLIPSDPALPPLVDVWATIGLERFRVPRKTEPHYAAMIVHLLNVAQEKRGFPPLRDPSFHR